MNDKGRVMIKFIIRTETFLKVNDGAISNYASRTTGVNQVCPGKLGCEVILDIRQVN